MAGTRMIEITEFAQIECVNPVYFEKSLISHPDKGGEPVTRK